MSHRQLSHIVQQILPTATIIETPLAMVPEISLYLLNKTFAEHPMTSDEIRIAMDNPYYWIFCWASGQVLARWILDNSTLFTHKTVLDFGCGSGVAAIAAKLAGAKEVIACDIDSDALTASRYNAELNGVELRFLTDFDQLIDKVDSIIVADVLYDRENLSWLDHFITKADSTIIADSRIKNFEHLSFKKIDQIESFTLPDLGESQEFRQVSLYHSIT